MREDIHMRWRAKESSIYDGLKKKFAFLPKRVDDEWVWLECYYSLTVFNIFGCFDEEYRWRTREEAEYDIERARSENAD